MLTQRELKELEEVLRKEDIMLVASIEDENLHTEVKFYVDRGFDILMIGLSHWVKNGTVWTYTDSSTTSRDENDPSYNLVMKFAEPVLNDPNVKITRNRRF